MFADDMILIIDSKETVQKNLKIYQKELRKTNMKINIKRQDNDNTGEREKTRYKN